MEFSLTGVSYCAPGRMLLNDSRKGPSHLHYRRPYGCAVLSVLDVLQSLTELKEEKDFVLKVYTCNSESEWAQIHENIIRKSSAKYSAPSASHGNRRLRPESRGLRLCVCGCRSRTPQPMRADPLPYVKFSSPQILVLLPGHFLLFLSVIIRDLPRLLLTKTRCLLSVMTPRALISHPGPSSHPE